MRILRAALLVGVGLALFPCARYLKRLLSPSAFSVPTYVYREQAHREVAKTVPCRVLFLGDSLTDCLDDLPEWYTELAPSSCVNLGMSWDRAADLLKRVERGDFDGAKPETIVLLIGTNDIALEQPTPSSRYVASRVERIVAELRLRIPGARVVLMALLPRGDKFSTHIKEANSLLAQIKDVTFIDIGPSLLKDGTVNLELLPDGVHLSPAGYRVWLDALRPFIVQSSSGPHP